MAAAKAEEAETPAAAVLRIVVAWSRFYPASSLSPLPHDLRGAVRAFGLQFEELRLSILLPKLLAGEFLCLHPIGLHADLGNSIEKVEEKLIVVQFRGQLPMATVVTHHSRDERIGPLCVFLAQAKLQD